jgi:hypothetical protein
MVESVPLWIVDGTRTYNRRDWRERKLGRCRHYHVLATVKLWLR